MFKKTIFIGALFMATLSAQAQTSVSKPYIGIKCPQCPQTTAPLLKWDYEKERMTETLTNPDVRGSITLDWANQTVRAGGETYKMDKYEVSAYDPIVTVTYAKTRLTIYYSPQSKYIGHTIE